MNAEDLRSVQISLQELLPRGPQSALVDAARAQGRLGEGVSCKIETGKALCRCGAASCHGGTWTKRLLGRLLLSSGGLRRGDGPPLPPPRYRAAGCFAPGGRRSGLSWNPGRVKGGSRRLPEHPPAVHARHRCFGGAACHAPAPDREDIASCTRRSPIRLRCWSRASPSRTNRSSNNMAMNEVYATVDPNACADRYARWADGA